MKPTDLPNLAPGMKISDGKRTLEVLHVHTIDNDGEGSAAADAVVWATDKPKTFKIRVKTTSPEKIHFKSYGEIAEFWPPDLLGNSTAIISAIDANNWSIVQ